MFNTTTSTKLFGLMGKPLGQSAAPYMHNSVYQKLGIDALYIPIEMDMADLGPAIENMTKLRFAGTGVTMPFKTQAHKFLDGLADSALFTEVVNTVEITADGKKIGHNTDGTGFVLSLENQLGLSIPEHRYLLLGAGGAGTAIACALAMKGAKTIRSLCIAQDYFCAETLFGKVEPHFPGICEIAEMTDGSIRSSLRDFDVVIHATKVGMYPNCDEILFDPDFLAPSNIVCDVVYVPVKTKLLIEAVQRGCRVLSGLWMNVNQAAEQMRIWLGLNNPPLDFMYEGSYDFLKSQGKYSA
jgi:shikimate dehydrogenase